MLEPLRLGQLTVALDARLIGEDAVFSAVSTDSRAIGPGQLFIALSGPRFDGHDYLAEVAAKGAVAALVEREVADAPLPQLLVRDTRAALGRLGALNRRKFTGPLAAMTGSSGKTTVKEMLASILRTQAGDAESVLATRGNLNNDLGVPLTLLQLAPQHRSAVIELGASRIGEIAYTVELTRPHVAIITNAGTAHVGEFGGPEKIVEAKGEILEGLAADGTAVLNLDDKAFDTWKARASGRPLLTFSLDRPQADFRAADLQRDARGCMGFRLQGVAGEAQVQLNLLGRHNVANALAAAAAAHALGVPLDGIVAGLQALQPVKGRAVAQLTASGLRVIDDSYNANPASMLAAIDILSGFSGRTVLVLGDMGELGSWAEQAHREVGAYAAGKVSALYAVGPLMAHAVQAFGATGRHFADQASLIGALATEQPTTTILIKVPQRGDGQSRRGAVRFLRGESLMLLLLAEYLQQFYKGFGVFQYLTLRGILSVLTALSLSLWLGPWMIRTLQIRQIGQAVRNDGPQSHLSKKGTPTMGGALILTAIAISTLLWADLSNRYVWVVLVVTLLFGAIGWVDDYRKVIEKNSRGLPSRWKYFWQSVFGIGAAVFLYMTAETPIETTLIVPMLKSVEIQLGIFFVVLTYFVIVGSSNAVNLTDGLDGLAIMPTVMVAGALGIFCYLSGNVKFAEYLLIPNVPGAGELIVFCAALVGAGLGFLWFNTYPAQVFMGDVGALALGAALGTIAVIVRQEIVLFIMGGVFVMETLSVMIQVASFKLTGRRVFRMAPIHHHFELKGWPEPRVIVRFWIITVILVLIGLATLKLR